MADTAAEFANHPALERPKVTEREPLHWNQLKFGQAIPPASELKLEEINLADPELWRRQAYWDLFARMRKEAPLHWCEESFVGGFWSVTRYEDVMKVDIDHQRFSSSWEHGGITLGESPEDFDLPMFIAMDAVSYTHLTLPTNREV